MVEAGKRCVLIRARKQKKAKNQRVAQREATKKQLVEAASRLFARDGFDGVSVTDIGKEAGVSASLINAHFGGKGGLLYQIVTENNAPQVEAARRAAARSRTAMGKLEKIVAAFAKTDLSDPRLLAAMEAYSWTWPPETEADNVVQRAVVEDLLAEVVEEGMASGEFRRLDRARCVKSIWGIYTWGLRDAVFHGATPEGCTKDISAQLRDLLLAE